MSRLKKKFPTASKAKKILKEGRAKGKQLNPKQKRLFGFIASGRTPTRQKG